MRSGMVPLQVVYASLQHGVVLSELVLALDETAEALTDVGAEDFQGG